MRVMSFLPNFLNAQKRDDEAGAPAKMRSRGRDPDDDPTDTVGNNVFELVPPQTDPEPVAVPPEPVPAGRNEHPVDMTDLSRLSIDRDGRLYWDGNPVKVRRELLMTRAQVVGASLIAAFIVIGAIGATLQGASAARDLLCRLGWTSSTCTLSAPPQPRFDIPA